MHMEPNPYPVVYFAGRCGLHDCVLNLRLEEPKIFQGMIIIGGQVTLLSCTTGGSAKEAVCLSDWELSITSDATITVTQ
jgi:hypothetical protein